MEYLKLFDNYKSYSPIAADIYFDESSKNVDEINVYDISILKNFLDSDIKDKYKFEGCISFSVYTLEKNIIVLVDLNRQYKTLNLQNKFYIKRNKDEWYYILMDNLRYGSKNPDYMCRYFKCDQMQGVLSFLKEHIYDNLIY